MSSETLGYQVFKTSDFSSGRVFSLLFTLLFHFFFPARSTAAVGVIYHTLTKLDNPPLRLPLGKEAVQGCRTQAKAYEENASKFESLSDNLLLDGKESMEKMKKMVE